MARASDVTVVLPATPLTLNREAAEALLALLLDAYADRIANEQAETDTAA